MQTASGSEQCPSEAAGETWSPQCFDVINETRRLKQEFVSKVKFDPHGFAAISIGQPIELAIVNRRGEIVIPHIRHTGDFDYPDAPSRIGRFAVEYNKANGEPASKCGYFSLDSYQIIVPAQFDHCQAFKKALSSLSVDDSECDAEQLLDRSDSPTIQCPVPPQVIR